ncbi:type II toxin-antitoxin system HicA family toxin [Candidatus Bipolaricaulota bacterium]
MAFSKAIHDQIKNLTKQQFIKALERDGFELDQSGRASAILVYRHEDGRRVTVHWHTRQGFGRDRLKKMLKAVGWTSEEDLRRVRLVR